MKKLIVAAAICIAPFVGVAADVGASPSPAKCHNMFLESFRAHQLGLPSAAGRAAAYEGACL